MSTFVSVGNATQPFWRLLNTVCENAVNLPQPLKVQSGAARGFVCASCDVVDFVTMEAFERYVAEAEVLILHAGAGSVIHAVRSGKTPIVMPRRAHFDEHVDDHQLEFAMELAATGKVVVCEDEKQLINAVSKARELDRRRHDQNTDARPALVESIRSLLRVS